MRILNFLMAFVFLAFITSKACGANLIVNGSFEQGYTGFSTTYSYVTSGTIIDTQGRFAITTDPKILHPFMADYHDHTTGSGNMLVANGAATGGAIWEETISVTANTNYEFSFWASTANEYEPSNINPANLQYFINDVSLGTIELPTQYGLWVREFKTWNSEMASSATIRIVDADTAQWGNDFALDDITLTPEPATLLLLGFGAALLRRK